MFKVDLDNVDLLLEEIDEVDDDEVLDQEDEVEDPENDEMIVEQILKDALSPEEIEELPNDKDEVEALTESGLLSERTIVRFDKPAKFNRAQSQSILAIAREKNDKDYKKLLTVWKMRKFLLKKLERKYGNQAKVRAKKNMRKVSKTNGKVGRKVGKRMKKK